jgi:hypothetical protein
LFAFAQKCTVLGQAGIARIVAVTAERKTASRRNQSPLGRMVQLRSVVKSDVEITGIVARTFYREERVLSGLDKAG